MTPRALNIPECPRPLAAILGRLPAWPPAFLLVSALNVGLARQLPQDVRDQLKDRKLCIEVRDANLRLYFTWNGTRFAALPRQATSDLTISASGPDFVRLARREEDPDTLFFSRRLLMEGDTELGLLVKNTLDALDMPVLDLSRFFPRRTATHDTDSPNAQRRNPWTK